MDPLILAPLLAIAAKNLVEMLKHFANVGGPEDPAYTPRKGVYAAAAPILLAMIAFIAENQGVTLNLLGQLGVNIDSPLVGAILSAILVGLAAPEAYDVQNLVKAKVKTGNEQAVAMHVQTQAIALQAGVPVPNTPPPSVTSDGAKPDATGGPGVPTA